MANNKQIQTLVHIINEIESRVRDVVFKMNGEAAALLGTMTIACDYKGSALQLFSTNMNIVSNKQVVQDLYKTTQELKNFITQDFSQSETSSNIDPEKELSISTLA
jgi:hypothetical protein